MSTSTRTRRAAAPAGKTSTQQVAREANRAPIPTAGNAPHSTVMDVTPAIAEDWLGRNTHNRPIRQHRIDELVGIINRGEWRVNNNSIAFDLEGTLLDGQHRLWAIVLTETTVPCIVSTGLTSDAQETMDTGARRSLKDTLVLDGTADASKVAAALTYKWRYDHGFIRNSNVRPTIRQAKEVLVEHPGFPESLRQAGRINNRFRGSVGMLSTVLYELSSIDDEDCDTFVEKLLAGAGLEEGDAILALRRHLERQSLVSVGARASALVTHALIIKAWNAWREGRQVTNLTWKASGMNPESFPEPR